MLTFAKHGRQMYSSATSLSCNDIYPSKAPDNMRLHLQLLCMQAHREGKGKRAAIHTLLHCYDRTTFAKRWVGAYDYHILMPSFSVSELNFTDSAHDLQ